MPLQVFFTKQQAISGQNKIKLHFQDYKQDTYHKNNQVAQTEQNLNWSREYQILRNIMTIIPSELKDERVKKCYTI